MTKKKIVIGRDFQGWPVYAYNLKSILKMLGFKHEDGKYTIEDSNPILRAFPRLLEDDGMGYGVTPQYISEVDNVLYDNEIHNDKVKVFNIFREAIDKQGIQEYEEDIKAYEEKYPDYKGLIEQELYEKEDE